MMIERVRAILVTSNNELLTIRRERPGSPTYWVLPGGHVDATDLSREDALIREIREEVVGNARIHGLLHILQSDTERQYFYVGRIDAWSFEDRTGPEFQEPGRGRYCLDLFPLTPTALANVNLKPDAIGTVLCTALAENPDLFGLPGLPAARGRS
jgi:ADP-ribose pyrophosphatase YjhB (NUDIX family)